jgi:YVTN family beta-propeller protein
MIPIRTRIVLAILACIALVGYFAVPASSPPAEAQGGHAAHPFGSSQFQRDLTPQAFAARASRIAALRGIDTRSYVKQFTALARRQRSRQTGTQPNGLTLLVNSWSISPAGRQMALGDFPTNAVLSPDGNFLLVSNDGAGVQSLQVISTAGSRLLQTVPFYAPHTLFLGLAYSPDGKSAFASGGGEDVIHTFSVGSDGTLTSTGDIQIGTAKDNPYPAGLSVSGDGKTLYVANNVANTVAIVDVASRAVTATVPVGNSPYATLVDPFNGMVYVSNWGDGTLSMIDPSTQAVVSTIAVGNHPSAMTLSPHGQLFVADSNSDAVSVVVDREVNRLSVGPVSVAPLSSSPQSLAVSPDGKELYVANAGDNALAVFSLDGTDRGQFFQGWIPTAWYPTSVVMSRDGNTLFATNGFGQGEGPNNTGLYPDPTRKSFPGTHGVQGYNDRYCSCSFTQFTATMNVGTLSTIAVPSKGQLTDDTLQVVRNDHFFDTSLRDRSTGNPIPVPGGASPIKHVIYIEKENRTYDQVFGDESIGNGDPSLTLFGKAITPNEHALAERFGLLDNFYADAQASQDGHNWVFSANASDYTEKIWPQVSPYSPSPGRNRRNDFEGKGLMPLSPGGYIWDAAAAAGITYRDYGDFFDKGDQGTLMPVSQSNTCTGPVAHTYLGTSVPAGSVLCFQPQTVNAATTPNLVGHADLRFRRYDLNFREADRFAEWKREFDQFVANDNLPQLELVRLGNDHTNGTAPGSLAPQYMVAENDAAVGQVVDAVSHSKYWASTAIFITEDDAQNGPDHVDSHRTTSLVISPYTSQASPRVEHTHYDTASMLRTVELILGLKPLSKYDAMATPMWQMFGAMPDTAPYTALPEITAAKQNTLRSYGARQSARMNFVLPDQIPMDELNRVLWYAIKGARIPYPQIHGASPTHKIPSSYAWGTLGQSHLPTNTLPH